MNRNAKLVFGAGLLSAVVGSVGCGWILGLDEFVDAPVGTGVGGGGGGAGGAGGATACSPGATESCYGGPAGTEGVGLCKAGTRSCLEDGSGWGACEGEVLPAQESCAEPADENCDGLDCVLWAKVLEESGGTGYAVAVGPRGDIVVTGDFGGTITMGGDVLISAGGEDIFLLSFDAAGNYRWGKQFSNAADQSGVGVAFDQEGNIVLIGTNSGSLSFGGPNVGPGLVVAKLASDGSYLWSRSFGGTPHFGLNGRPGLAIAPSNDIIIGGAFSGTMAFDDGSLSSSSPGTDLIVAKLRASDGSTAAAANGWARRFGGPGTDTFRGLGVDAAGSIILTGNHADGTTFDGQPPLSPAGMYLVKLDANGTAAWSKNFVGASPATVAITATGDAIVAGGYTEVDFGGDPLPSSGDMFLARFTPAGSHEWSLGFSGTSTLDASSIAVTSNDHVLATGTFRGQVDFGAGPVMGTSDTIDGFVLETGPEGQALWSRGIGGSGHQGGNHVAVTADGGLLVTGFTFGPVDFGAGPVGSSGQAFFLARLAR